MAELQTIATQPVNFTKSVSQTVDDGQIDWHVVEEEKGEAVIYIGLPKAIAR